MHLLQLSRPQFFCQDNEKNNLDYINLQVINKDQTHLTGPHSLISLIIMSMSCSLNTQFIHQNIDHASYKRILHMAKIGIYTGLPKSIPKISHPYHAYIIDKGPYLPLYPKASTESLDPGTCFHLDFSFSNRVSCQNFTSALTIVDDTTTHLFGYTTRSKHPS